MKNYDLKGIEDYFNNIGNLNVTHLVSYILYDAILNCNEENFEKDIYENCDTREEAEKWARRYVKIGGLVYDIFTLFQYLKDGFNHQIEYLELVEKRLKNE